ncbi:MAG: hypothetical protein Q9M48_15785 [Rhodobacterales bacterium]|nr:hypothetical protein [Rhodobacterales bacterium]
MRVTFDPNWTIQRCDFSNCLICAGPSGALLDVGMSHLISLFGGEIR